VYREKILTLSSVFFGLFYQVNTCHAIMNYLPDFISTRELLSAGARKTDVDSTGDETDHSST
jgi:hypothetical protein